MMLIHIFFFQFNVVYLCLGKIFLLSYRKVIDKKVQKNGYLPVSLMTLRLWAVMKCWWIAQIFWHPLAQNRNSLHPFCVTRYWTEQAAQLLLGWVRNKNSTLCRNKVNFENITVVLGSLQLPFWKKYWIFCNNDHYVLYQYVSKFNTAVKSANEGHHEILTPLKLNQLKTLFINFRRQYFACKNGYQEG